MKGLLMITVLAIAVYSCDSKASDSKVSGAKAKQALEDTLNYTTAKWIDSLYDFGTVTKGEKVEMKFRVKNTGNKPLIISEARPGCGCTVADYTKEAIPPGGQGEVTGVYDSNRGVIGTVHKSIFVSTNTKGNTQHILIFSGQVKEKS